MNLISSPKVNLRISRVGSTIAIKVSLSTAMENLFVDASISISRIRILIRAPGL